MYNNNLFNTSSCVEKGIEGDEHAPVISVSDEPATSQETITITYHGVKVSLHTLPLLPSIVCACAGE